MPLIPILIIIVVYIVSATSAAKKKLEQVQKKQAEQDERKEMVQTSTKSTVFTRSSSSSPLPPLKTTQQSPLAPMSDRFSGNQDDFDQPDMESESDFVAHFSLKSESFKHGFQERPEKIPDAEEGEDPCHEYMLNDQRANRISSERGINEQPNTLIEDDLVRGIVMSEILTRPQNRMHLRAYPRVLSAKEKSIHE